MRLEPSIIMFSEKKVSASSELCLIFIRTLFIWNTKCMKSLGLKDRFNSAKSVNYYVDNNSY